MGSTADQSAHPGGHVNGLQPGAVTVCGPTSEQSSVQSILDLQQQYTPFQ